MQPRPVSTNCSVAVIIPALNEAQSIGKVIDSIPASLSETIIVVDNGSTDGTGEIARQKGAIVIREERRGYGSACLSGIGEADNYSPDILIFIDADSSDDPDDLERVLEELLKKDLDMVIGSRTRGDNEPGALPFHARLGNNFVTWILFLRYGVRFTDLGPLRAIRTEALKSLAMQDIDYGWTVEMQVKALQARLKVSEIPVSYRQRIGKSKISGTVKGSFLAGYKILLVTAKYCLFSGIEVRNQRISRMTFVIFSFFSVTYFLLVSTGNLFIY